MQRRPVSSEFVAYFKSFQVIVCSYWRKPWQSQTLLSVDKGKAVLSNRHNRRCAKGLRTNFCYVSSWADIFCYPCIYKTILIINLPTEIDTPIIMHPPLGLRNRNAMAYEDFNPALNKSTLWNCIYLEIHNRGKKQCQKKLRNKSADVHYFPQWDVTMWSPDGSVTCCNLAECYSYILLTVTWPRN